MWTALFLLSYYLGKEFWGVLVASLDGMCLAFWIRFGALSSLLALIQSFWIFYTPFLVSSCFAFLFYCFLFVRFFFPQGHCELRRLGHYLGCGTTTTTGYRYTRVWTTTVRITCFWIGTIMETLSVFPCCIRQRDNNEEVWQLLFDVLYRLL